MQSFPVDLVDELNLILTSVFVDESGKGYPFSEDWFVRELYFDNSKTRRRVSIFLEYPVTTSLRVQLEASDFRMPKHSPNEGKYSDLAFEISVILQEEIFSRSPEDFLANPVTLTPIGLRGDVVRKVNLQLGRVDTRNGWRVVRKRDS
jgi:hypothetical protein